MSDNTHSLEKKPIIIDLENSENAEQFDESNLIHRREFETVNKIVTERLKKLKEQEEQKKLVDKKDSLDTITILGGRGSGKTSFLLSLSKDFQKNDSLEVIDLIDPTMIENKGHVFLTIISQIEDKVNDKIKGSYCNTEGEDITRNKQWREKLHHLAAGLPTLDGVGGNMEDWQDPEFVMDKGLRNVKAAMSLAGNFHDLVKHALTILKKDAFILMLDDIDIDFQKGWPVLETVRKYLTTPLIITFVSGDLRLFTKAVRKKQWGNFGKALLKNEGDKLGQLENYNELVTEMNGQYLNKVLKTQYRITLRTLLAKLNFDKELDIRIKPTPEIPETHIIAYYNNILSKFGIKTAYQVEAYRSFLMTLPLRSQIQFLISLKGQKEDNNIDMASCMSIFLNELHEKNINIELAGSMPKYTNHIILEALVKDKILDEAYQLQPTTLDLTTNSCLMALTILSSLNNIDNRYLIFDYLIRIGYTRNLLSILGYREGTNRVFCIDDLIKHSALLQDRNVRDTVCYTTSYMRAFLNADLKQENFNPFVGSICLYSINSNNEKNISSKFKTAVLYKQQLAYIPASISQPTSKASSTLTYSIYVLLGAITDIAKIYTIDKGIDEDEKQNKIALKKSLAFLSQLRGYPMPSNTYMNINYAAEEVNDNIYDDNNSDANDELVEMMLNWLKQPNTMVVSPHILGKISTRIFYAIKRIDSEHKGEKLGEAMHRRIIAVMNSILIEDARENINDDLNLSNNNPVSSDKIFLYNLEKVNKYSDMDCLSFSKWMLSCPLFLLYLNYKDEDLEFRLSEFIKEKNFLPIKYSIYDQLQDVDVRYSLNKNTSKEGEPNTNPKFSIKEGPIEKVIEKLKGIVGLNYDDFMSNDIESLRKILKPHFSSDIRKDSFAKIKAYIKNNSTTW